VRYLWARAVGVRRARNEGIRAARTQILAFTDDDTLVTRSSFGTLIRALIERGPNAVVTGQVRPAEEGDGGVVLSTVVEDTPAVHEGRMGVDILFPPNMAIYRSVIDNVGLFDRLLGRQPEVGRSWMTHLALRLLDCTPRLTRPAVLTTTPATCRARNRALPCLLTHGSRLKFLSLIPIVAAGMDVASVRGDHGRACVVGTSSPSYRLPDTHCCERTCCSVPSAPPLV